MAGIRVDHLTAGLDENHLRVWEGMRHRIREGTMPPKGMPQPSPADRDQMVAWISKALEIARSRPLPKNGLVRRLTVAQYRNTIRELLQLDDDVTETLPPDAISRDGFVNNKETLQLSPLLLEAYLDIADDALGRAIVDPASKPVVQNFRMDLGRSVNPAPIPDELILGANSLLLKNSDVKVEELTPAKPFAFEPFRMQTKFRFIEGYRGNDTVRGWRDFDSIYHAVFADMRGSRGYPKGEPYSTVPQGLLLRPAIPNDELFEQDGTYGPKANFKISLRELPDHGRFRVTVTAAKYNDGLLLDSGAAAQAAEAPGSLSARAARTAQTVTVPKAGIYQVDVHASDRTEPTVPPETTRLTEGLSATWTLDDTPSGGSLFGSARFVESPFGRAVTLDGQRDALQVPRNESMNIGEGDFTVAAWIRPQQLKRAGIFSLGGHNNTHGWNLSMADNKGTLRLETAGPDNQSNGAVATAAGTLRPAAWQHVSVVVRRGKRAQVYVNGYPAGRGAIGPANLDNPAANLFVARLANGHYFRGDIDEVRLYRRALSEGEVQGLVEPGRRFAVPPPNKTVQLSLTLGDREFSGNLTQPAFLAVRLPAGPLALNAEHTGWTTLERIQLTPLALDHPVSRRFLAFEKRAPRLGVHLGLRRDCGSTLAPVGTPQTVTTDKLTKFVFEGAIRNYPSPDVEKDNVNYLAGIREIGVRSEYTDGRDMPRLLIRSVEFEGPFYETWPPPAHKNIFVDYARKSDRTAYAKHIIRSFAARAYRRPVTAAEEASLMKVFQDSTQSGRSFEAGVKDALQVVLTSPQFLFLIETSSTPEPEPLDDHELASKLSYFLWNGPPDRATLKLAAAGALRKSLDTEVDRMVADRRFNRFINEFVSQWLQLDKISVLEPDRKRFPDLTRDARAQLRQEPVEFVRYLIRNNLPVRNLINSDFVVVNEAVATYYDLATKPDSGFDFVAVPHRRRELGGVLSQAALMAGLSDGRESNPVKRGAWLARKIVAEPPDDPPPNVPALSEDTTGLTLRQRLEQHRNQPGCQQCHTKIDPWGVALEEFDASGRLKREPADASSVLPDKTQVSGIHDLRRYLAEDRIDQVAFSVLKHLATYATGRSLSYYELNLLKKDGLKLKADGYRMKDMVRYVVGSKMFLEK